MLTVVVGRAVFGTSITISEAWQRLRPRLWALIGFTVIEVIGAVVLVAVVVLIISGVAVAAGGVAAAIAGVPLVLALIVGLVYLGTMLSFAPSLIVLERLQSFAAISRSFKLVQQRFLAGARNPVAGRDRGRGDRRGGHGAVQLRRSNPAYLRVVHS